MMKMSHRARRAIASAGLWMLLWTNATAQNEAEVLFKARCASCHGGDGTAKTAAAAKLQMPSLRSAEVQKLTDDQLYDTIALGTLHKNYPHNFLQKGMDEAQIRQLVRYIRSLAPKPAAAHGKR
jgi:mono/diheme cytochrome c family protein